MATGVYKRTAEHGEKISVGLRKLDRSGEKSSRWTGGTASYSAVHHWIKRWFGKPDRCENAACIYPRKNNAYRTVIAPKRFEWALIRGRKYSHKREDYIMLFPSCHRKYDMELIKIDHLKVEFMHYCNNLM